MKHTLKRMLSLLMALIMVIGMVPTGTFHVHAAEGDLVKVTAGSLEYSYATMEAAWERALTLSGVTIQLLGDCAASEVLSDADYPYGVDVTLDLNGHNLTLAGVELTCHSLTIIDSGDPKGSLTVSQGSGYPPLFLNPDADGTPSLTLDGVTVTTDYTYTLIRSDCVRAMYAGNSEVSIIIRNSNVSGGDLIEARGNTTVTIQNSTLTAADQLLLLKNNDSYYQGNANRWSSATVENSTLSGATGITVGEGCSFTATGTDAAPCSISSSSYTSSVIDAEAGSAVTMTGVSVSGGTRSVDLDGATGSFADCTFGTRVYMIGSAAATFTGCTFAQNEAFYIARDAQAVCVGCEPFENIVFESSNPGGLTVWNEEETSATVYGEVALTENLTIPEGTTYNFVTYEGWDGAIPAKLILGDYTVTNNGTIQVDGVEHICPVTGSAEEVEEKDDASHHIKVTCTDCPISYVSYGDEASHSMDSATGLCSGCGMDMAAVSVTVGEYTAYYVNFADAFEDYLGDAAPPADTVNIKILKDCGTSNFLEYRNGATCVLDLNGNLLTLDVIDMSGGSSMTILDTNADGDGILDIFLLYVFSGSELKLKSGTIRGVSNNNVIEVDGTFTMTGGTVTHSIDTSYGVRVFKSGNADIRGGSISSLVLDAPATGTVSLSGGTFTNSIVTGSADGDGAILGDIMATGYKLVDADGNDVDLQLRNADGPVTVVCTHPANYEGSTAADCVKLAYCGLCKQTYGNLGSHSINPADGYCKYGCGTEMTKLTVTQGETTTYYADLESAAAAITGTATVTVLKGFRRGADDSVVTLPAQNITLELNGEVLDYQYLDIEIAEGGKLTVQDSTNDAAGQLFVEDLTVAEGAELVLPSGTIIVASQVAVDGKVTLSGDAAINSSSETVSKSTLCINQGGEAVISGGYVEYFRAAYSDTGLDCTLTLTGGAFGRISTGTDYNDEIKGVTVQKAAANGYQFVDAASGEAVASGLYSASDVKVVCAHSLGNTSDATCQTLAVCATCGESYGELGDHGNLEVTTGNCDVCGEFIASVSVSQGENTVYFATIDEAMTALGQLAEGEKLSVKLLEDVSASGELAFPAKALELDLNGKKLAAHYYGVTIAAGGTLTVTDSSEEKLGSIYFFDGKFAVPADAKLVLNSGTISAGSYNYNHLIQVDGAFEMTGGAATHSNARAYAVFAKSDCSIKISGGRISNFFAPGSSNGLYCEVVLSGGTFDTIEVYEESASGGLIFSRLSYALAPGCYFQDAQGNKIEDIGDSTDGILNNVTVVCGHAGGTATCVEKAVCVTCGEIYGDYGDHGSLEVTTGDCTLCGEFAAGICVTQGENTWYYGKDFHAVLAEIGSLTGTDPIGIKLLADITHSEQNSDLTFPAKTVELDLNGKTLAQNGISSGITLSGTRLTVTDSSEEKTGTVYIDTKSFDVPAGAALILQSGTITTSSANTGELVYLRGELEMTGGAVIHPNANRRAIYMDYCKAKISGGTVSSLHVTESDGDLTATVSLSGGSYGVIKAYDEAAGAYISLLSQTLAPGYGFQDAQGNRNEAIDGFTDGTLTNVTVVCAHTLGNTSDATCQTLAVCAKCGESYGEKADHVIDNTDGYCAIDGCEEYLAVASLTQGETTTFYADVAGALAAVTGKASIQLLKDGSVPQTSDFKFYLPAQDVTLDLNGRTLSFSNYVFVPDGGTFTLTDTTETQTGKLSAWELSPRVGGELVIAGGTLEGSSEYYTPIRVYGKLTMTGGAVTHSNSRGIYVEEGGEAVISGGSVSSFTAAYRPNDSAIYCTVTLSGGTFGQVATGDSSVYGGVNVSKILADGYKYVDAASGEDVDGEYTNEVQNVTVVCAHPANFEGSTPADCKNLAYCGQCGESYGELGDHGALEVTTGNCTVCGEFAAVVSMTAGEQTTYYKSLSDAVKAAENQNASITFQLLQDVRTTESIDLPAGVYTLDLNGRSLFVGEITTGGILTVRDTNEDGGGILAPDKLSVASGSELKLESGTIQDNESVHAIYVYGTFTMSGGAVPNANGICITETGRADISGGSIRYLYLESPYTGTVSLSGGTYEYLCAGDSHDQVGKTLFEILADGYKLVNRSGIDVTPMVYEVAGPVTVVCTHTLLHADNTDATCRQLAYCGNCKTYYGEIAPDKHNMDSSTGKCTLCYADVAAVSVTQGTNTFYYESFDEAKFALYDFNPGDPVTLKLLKNQGSTGENISFDTYSFPLTLDLNGFTLNAGFLFCYSPDLTVQDTSASQSGKISLVNCFDIEDDGFVTLLSGTITAPATTIRLFDNGSLTVSGGKVVCTASSFNAIYIPSANASLTVTGGTVQGGRTAVWNNGNSGNISLSGGIFLGNLIACSDDADPQITLNDLLAEGYKYVVYDNGITDTDYDGTASEETEKNLAVVCAHPASYTGSTAATCSAKAYCAQCGESYGEILPHEIDSATGKCKNGCNEDLSVTMVATGTSRTYFASFAEAIAYVDGLDVDDRITIFVTANTTHDGAWVLSDKSVQLNLQRNTLELTSITNNNSGKTLTISSTGGEGLLKLTGPNGGIHMGGGNVTLLSGTVQATANDAVIVSKGVFIVNGGTVKSDVANGIYVNASTAAVYVNGGTIQSAGTDDCYALKRNADTNIELSGGIFLGGISKAFNDSSIGDSSTTISLLAASGYGVFYYDAENQSVGDQVRDNLIGTTNDLAVVCVHASVHYSTSGSKLSVFCDNESCYMNGAEVGSMELAAPADPVYNGSGKQVVLEFTNFPDYNPANLSIAYEDAEGNAVAEPIDAGTYTATVTYDGYAMTLRYTVEPKELTPSITGSVSKTYDGTTDLPENHGLTITLDGIVTGDDVKAAAEYAYQSANADDNKDVIANNVTLEGADAGNYTLSVDQFSQSVGSISKAELTVTADDKAVTYGDQAPEYTVSYSGFVNGENETFLGGELSFACDYDTADPAKRGAGSYTVTAGGLSNSNYEIIFKTGTLTVGKAWLSLVPDDKTVVYGENAPEYTYSFEGLKYDDTASEVNISVTLTSDYTPGAKAGSSFNIAVTNDWDDTAEKNYAFGRVYAGTLFVKQRPVTASISGYDTKYYDGTTSVTEDVALFLDNVYGSDDLSVTGILEFSQADVGTDLTVIASGLTLSGLDMDNYYLVSTTASAVAGTILPLDISHLTLEAQDRIYTGQELSQTIHVPAVNGLSPTYTVTGDTATGIGHYTVTVTGTGNFTGTTTCSYYIRPNTAAIDVLNTTSVTSDDRAALEALLDEVNGADRQLADAYLNDFLDYCVEKCSELLEHLDKVDAADETAAIQAVENITEDNVKLDDKLDLEKAKLDLEAALNNYSGNYTSDERSAIEEDLDRIEKALAAIANAEAVDSAVETLPETLDPEDKEAMEQVEEAKEAYDALTEAEQSMVPQEQKDKLEDLLAQLEAIENASVTRIYGADRYETALKVADELKAALGVEQFQTVIVARGSAFADALSGSYLANKKNAPILLVKDGKEQAVKDYILRNLVPGGTVYILGGLEAVPATMEVGLEAFAVKRLGGADRYETNLLILKEAGVASGDILIATGGNYADALSASALDLPVLLVSYRITQEQLALLKSVPGKKIILGGEHAVNAKVENWIRTTGETVRIGGADRYETSVLLAKQFFPNADKAVVAYGGNFPDGLSGGPLANALHAPLVLTKECAKEVTAQYLASKSVTAGIVLGGSKLLSNDTVRAVFAMEPDAPIKVK